MSSPATTKRIEEANREFRRDNARPCALCGNGLAAKGVPIFYRVRVESFALDPASIGRADGLERLMGGGRVGALFANVLGPNEPLAKRFAPTFEALLCQPCAMESAVVPLLVEKDEAEGAALERAEAAAMGVAEPTPPSPDRRAHDRITLGDIDPDA